MSKATVHAGSPAVPAGPRAPSLLDALLPVGVLICLLALTIALFGIDATNGPLQVALLLSAAAGFKVPPAEAEEAAAEEAAVEQPGPA